MNLIKFIETRENPMLPVVLKEIEHEGYTQYSSDTFNMLCKRYDHPYWIYIRIIIAKYQYKLLMDFYCDEETCTLDMISDYHPQVELKTRGKKKFVRLVRAMNALIKLGVTNVHVYKKHLEAINDNKRT